MIERFVAKPAIAGLLSLLLLTSCDKDKAEPGTTTTASSGATSTSSSVTASAKAAASAGAASSAGSPSSATEGAAATYAGTYSASPATLYIPPDNKDYAAVKQAKDDASKMVGDGSLSLSVDPSGRLSGTVEAGPAAPAIIDGTVRDGAVTGTIRRKDASDDGLTGAIVGKVAGDAVEGTMKLADANASIVRQAKFTAKKK